MKPNLSIIAAIILFFSLTANSVADVFTADGLAGKWTFTHILMEGGEETKVNLVMEFLNDGTVVTYSRAGDEAGRGTYKVVGDRIDYTDVRGEQKWKVVDYKEDTLHVDHRGADMFFVR